MIPKTMRPLLFSILILLFSTNIFAQQDAPESDVRIITEYGTMLVKLYDETPKHRDNFLKLTQEGFYDSLLFHRVISGFMIQGGDPQSKNDATGEPLGNGGLDYLIPAEINSKYYHKKGALAAARQSDQVNPDKKSSACQFYIVQGRTSSPNILQTMEDRHNQKNPNNPINYSEQAKNDYATIGGAPHLDGGYTVFGEVVSGLEVIDKIAAAEVDGRNRPTENIIMKIELVK